MPAGAPAPRLIPALPGARATTTLVSENRVTRIRSPGQGCCVVSEPVSPSSAVEPRTSDTDEAVADTSEEELVIEDLLVEEVSIDGMCGVY